MIDVHTHLLPGIDDGASNIEEALLMTKSLAEQGIITAVCTPHFNPAEVSMEDFLKAREGAVQSIQNSGVKLIPGSEIFLHEYLFHYKDISPLCIGDTRYLLIEFPINKTWDTKNEFYVRQLINYYGIIPIIAHIERYKPILKNTGILKRLRDMGCLIQTNTSSVIEKRTSRLVIKYLQAGYIDLLGSDCHNMTTRPPCFTKALKEIKRKAGLDIITRLEVNSERVITGEYINKSTGYILD
ncbi:tyrosine-protein phosphatase [Anaerocolumna cellulosilytica]|nr:CpsB/CapC family capsule biosynthesis tyrosine phosphatase [Anaerocolumna cellulosilytica]